MRELYETRSIPAIFPKSLRTILKDHVRGVINVLMTRRNGREKRSTASFFAIAKFLGRISQNITIRIVITATARAGPSAPKNFSASVVATALAAIFTTLFPIRVTFIALAVLSTSQKKPFRRCGYSSDRASSFPFPAAVIDVSVALK